MENFSESTAWLLLTSSRCATTAPSRSRSIGCRSTGCSANSCGLPRIIFCLKPHNIWRSYVPQTGSLPHVSKCKTDDACTLVQIWAYGLFITVSLSTRHFPDSLSLSLYHCLFITVSLSTNPVSLSLSLYQQPKNA